MQTQSQRKTRMSFRAASQATLSFLSARKRIEDGLRNWSKRRTSKRGSIDEGMLVLIKKTLLERKASNYLYNVCTT